ncbi:MAG: hypothetical protein R2709_00105 [Marmoricola sp.]
MSSAIERANAAKEAKEPLSIGLLGNAANVFPELLRRHRAGEITIDIVAETRRVPMTCLRSYLLHPGLPLKTGLLKLKVT